MAKTFLHPNRLLDDIARGLRNQPRVRVADIFVTFKVNGESVSECGLITALDRIANDLTWDETGSWAEADSAVVN